jgi:hypothetical protein
MVYIWELCWHTLIAFLRSIKKASALCVKNLVNLCTSIFSISSACFILILIRTLLMLGSIRTFSFSFRDTVKGFKSTSGELAASISGTLCRSEVCEAKFESERAAVSEDRTH